MRLATWNLARPRPGSVRASRLLTHVALVDADVWVLTETHLAVSPGPSFRLAACSTAAPDTVSFTLKGVDAEGKKGVDAEGKPVRAEITSQYDGKDYPVTGSAGTDTISVKRIDDFTVDSVEKKDGKIVLTNHRVISEDGRVMTFTAKGTNAKGQTLNN